MGECIVGGLASRDIVVGYYTGDGAATRTISLGFTPNVVSVNAVSNTDSGRAVTGSSSTSLLSITTNGFVVGGAVAPYFSLNSANIKYTYLAGK